MTGQLVLIKVLNRKVNCVYADLFIVLHHQLLIDAPETQISISLHVEHAC